MAYFIRREVSFLFWMIGGICRSFEVIYILLIFWLYWWTSCIFQCYTIRSHLESIKGMLNVRLLCLNFINQILQYCAVFMQWVTWFQEHLWHAAYASQHFFKFFAPSLKHWSGIDRNIFTLFLKYNNNFISNRIVSGTEVLGQLGFLMKPCTSVFFHRCALYFEHLPIRLAVVDRLRTFSELMTLVCGSNNQ